MLSNIEHQYNEGNIQDIHKQTVIEALELAKQDIDELAGLVSDLARRMGPDIGGLKRC
jgi:hypothetical protein